MTAPLTPLLASQPVEALLVRLLAQFALMLLDQDAQDCWVLLEHGSVLSGRFGRVGAAGVGG